jgi:heme A synthase
MTSDVPGQPPEGLPSRRVSRHDLVVAGGALLYGLLGFLPWASVTFDVLGRVSASGYGLSVLVIVAAVLLVAAAAWALAPAVGAPAVTSPRGVVTSGLAATALLLTLVTWLRTTDYGFEPVPLLALLVTLGVAGSAARSLLTELRAAGGGRAGASSAEEPVPGGPPAGRH